MESNTTQSMDAISHDLFAVRSQKLKALCEQGHNPFEANCEQTHTSKAVLLDYSEAAEVEGRLYSVAGRITVYRDMGKSAFVKILDQDGTLQLYVKKDVVGEASYAEFKRLDMGDIIGAKGTIFQTKTGETTLRVTEWILVSKALRPLPEKWHGLTDSEQVYRQRYLDLIGNAESKERFMQRSQIIRAIREFLWREDFVEVETPVFQTIAGGAAARPFETHMQALNTQLYLRISLELYLKRMLIGGFDRVFELGRVFRNEGLSRRHNPEFTMLELYQAYTDYRGMMRLVYDLMQHICKTVLGGTQVTNANGELIELGGVWREVKYKDLIIEYTGDAQWFERSKAEKMARAKALGIEISPQREDFEVTNDVFSKLIEPTLIQPTFVTHLPKELCPLAKINTSDTSVIDVFELCINGQEIAPAYSEQNDPFVQRAMFAAQAGEDVHSIDQDFLLAMEHGMPPAGGMGIGIDRLVILLTGAANIRDTILFPTLKAID